VEATLEKQLSEALRDGRRRLGEFWLDQHFSHFSYAAACVLMANEVSPQTWTYERLLQLYRWLDKIFPCPWCDESLQRENVLVHPFDRHVRHGQHTVEELIDWIVSVEPAAEHYGREIGRGLYLRFATIEEFELVQFAARCSRQDLNAFILNAALFDARMTVPFARKKGPQKVRAPRQAHSAIN
jgi:hypothetical protein